MKKVLSADEFKARATVVIEIPDFDGKGTISIRVRRPQIMRLITSGKLPNPLLPTATRLLRNEKLSNANDDDLVAEAIKGIEIYCRACMVEPSFEQVEAYLTDEQMLAIFNWAISGAQELASFRTEQTNGTSNNDGKNVPEKTQ